MIKRAQTDTLFAPLAGVAARPRVVDAFVGVTATGALLKIKDTAMRSHGDLLSRMVLNSVYQTEQLFLPELQKLDRRGRDEYDLIRKLGV